MKRLYIFGISIIAVCLALIYMAGGNESDNNIVYGRPYTYELYKESNSSKVYHTNFSAETDIGVQFSAATAFNGFEIYLSDSAKTAKLAAALYKWEQNYAATVDNTPVFISEYTDIAKEAWLNISMPEMAAGEYVLELRNARGNIKVDIISPGMPYTVIYQDKSERDGSLKCRIKYVNTPETKLNPVSENIRVYNTTADTWVFTDGLGRTSPSYSETGKRKENKFVGIFYHTWHYGHAKFDNRNITEVLKEHPNIKNDYKSIIWPKAHTNYFWNEPLFGYYNNGTDKWVLRKHAELLADAGIDVVIFDQTNGTDTFMSAILTLLEVFAEARADGVKAPAITAMLPMFDYSNAAIQLREMYDVIYAKGLYKDLWFYWDGKPLMLAWPGELSYSDPTDVEIMNFFTYRPINPSYTTYDAQALDENGNVTIRWSPPYGVREDYICWKWISIYPQAVAYRKNGTPEQMCVCIAQNWSARQGITAMNAGDHVFGRSYSDNKGFDLSETGKLYGANVAEQWEYALKVDPDFIYITGWNEWVAGRFEEMWGTENAFPDNFSDNYSRDIEPSAGDLKDHYYYQMVSYIRKYKGTNDFQRSSGKKSIDIYSDEDQWTDILPEYIAYEGNTFERNVDGYKGHQYVNTTGRNDITGAKVSYDKRYIYFMVETKENLTDRSDKGWMRLLIDVNNSEDNWETFEYIVNRINPGEKATIERSKGGWNWETAGDADYTIKGSRLQIRIPKSILGIKGDRFEFNFKWSDNSMSQEEGNILDFYQYGDTAPSGRFKYRFVSTRQAGWIDFKTSIYPYIVWISAVLVIAAVVLVVVLRVKSKRT